MCGVFRAKLVIYVLPHWWNWGAVCLTIAVTALFARTHLYRDAPAPAARIHMQPSVANLDDCVVTGHFHGRTPYYVTGENGVHGLFADVGTMAFKQAGTPITGRKRQPSAS